VKAAQQLSRASGPQRSNNCVQGQAGRPATCLLRACSWGCFWSLFLQLAALAQSGHLAMGDDGDWTNERHALPLSPRVFSTPSPCKPPTLATHAKRYADALWCRLAVHGCGCCRHPRPPRLPALSCSSAALPYKERQPITTPTLLPHPHSRFHTHTNPDF